MIASWYLTIVISFPGGGVGMSTVPMDTKERCEALGRAVVKQVVHPATRYYSGGEYYCTQTPVPNSAGRYK